MGYNDLRPEAFLFSVAVQQTNTAEDAFLFDQWLQENAEKTKRLISAQIQGESDSRIKE